MQITQQYGRMPCRQLWDIAGLEDGKPSGRSAKQY